ncbi:hypothetical protein SISSUDRAFT_1046718 [Sistotremastrum suecicum HHB10207 ss-3]|uniref:DUF7587 domain-containing protein n=1 Tax=Sistotremastrum suecicum HHB10207 ss-3 TaxID=1314776 RepID=A0A166DJ75_9AGAM|nr:hypothetical protein SISSUDRAFT_1046718 [Sistotremastrum suecicum HHB10207 ss-3]
MGPSNDMRPEATAFEGFTLSDKSSLVSLARNGHSFLFRVHSASSASPLLPEHGFIAPLFQSKSPDAEDRKISARNNVVNEAIRHVFAWEFVRESTPFISASLSFGRALWNACYRRHRRRHADRHAPDRPYQPTYISVILLSQVLAQSYAETAPRVLRRREEDDGYPYLPVGTMVKQLGLYEPPRMREYEDAVRFSSIAHEVLVWGRIPASSIVATIDVEDLLPILPPRFRIVDLSRPPDIHSSPVPFDVNDVWSLRNTYPRMCREALAMESSLEDIAASSLSIARAILLPWLGTNLERDPYRTAKTLEVLALHIAQWPERSNSSSHVSHYDSVESKRLLSNAEQRDGYLAELLRDRGRTILLDLKPNANRASIALSRYSDPFRDPDPESTVQSPASESIRSRSSSRSISAAASAKEERDEIQYLFPEVLTTNDAGLYPEALHELPPSRNSSTVTSYQDLRSPYPFISETELGNRTSSLEQRAKQLPTPSPSREASPFPHPFNYTKIPRSAAHPAQFQPPPPPMPAPPPRRDTLEEIYSLPNSPFEERPTSPALYQYPRYRAAPILESSSSSPAPAPYINRPSLLTPITTGRPPEAKEWGVFPGGFPEEPESHNSDPTRQREQSQEYLRGIDESQQRQQPWVIIDLEFTRRSSEPVAWSPDTSP